MFKPDSTGLKSPVCERSLAPLTEAQPLRKFLRYGKHLREHTIPRVPLEVPLARGCVEKILSISQHGMPEPIATQLGKMGNVLFSVIYLRTALIQGMENANKTVSRFDWCANGGFLEG